MGKTTGRSHSLSRSRAAVEYKNVIEDKLPVVERNRLRSVSKLLQMSRKQERRQERKQAQLRQQRGNKETKKTAVKKNAPAKQTQRATTRKLPVAASRRVTLGATTVSLSTMDDHVLPEYIVVSKSPRGFAAAWKHAASPLSCSPRNFFLLGTCGNWRKKTAIIPHRLTFP